MGLQTVFTAVCLILSILLLVSNTLDFFTFDWALGGLYDARPALPGVQSCIPGWFSLADCKYFWEYQANYGPRFFGLLYMCAATISILSQIGVFATLLGGSRVSRIILAVVLSYISFIFVLFSIDSRTLIMNDFDTTCKNTRSIGYHAYVYNYVKSDQVFYTFFSLVFSFLIAQLSMLLGYFQNQRGSMTIEPIARTQPLQNNLKNVQITVKPIDNL